MKYYIVIGHKKGELVQSSVHDGIHDRVYDGEYDRPPSDSDKRYDCDWIEMIERDDEYFPDDYPPGAHQLFGYLDVNFNESVQYGRRATKTQEAWLIGRHRIARMLDFGNFGYQFVRREDTKRIQFPDKITLSFDKQIRDNGLDKPASDNQRVDIELTALNEQIINCYDKECNIDPVVFKLAKFDNYGDAYIDLQQIENYQDFKLHMDHFVHFMRNYPNSSIYLLCKWEHEAEIKNRLKNIIKSEHVTNYVEFCAPNFERRSPGWAGRKSGTPNSEYDTFSETIEEFFNENSFNRGLNAEKNFYNVPFKKAKITINDNWHVYSHSDKFKHFLQYNPSITLEIAGTIEAQEVAQFIRLNSIKANIVLAHDPNNQEIQEAIAHNRQDELQAVMRQHGYDVLGAAVKGEEYNEEYRLALEKYVPHKLGLASVEVQDADMQVGQNQNQNQNQNQSQQLRQSSNEPYEPPKLEINNKSSIPDVDFAKQDSLLKSVIGLPFQSGENAPQTETNINHLFAAMEKIIKDSPASKDCYCPLSYSVEELIPGAFYVPKEKVKSLPHPNSDQYAFNENQNTLFFSPPYASIAIKKDRYAFKPYHRPTDISAHEVSSGLVDGIHKDKFINELIGEYSGGFLERKFNLLLNKLYAKRGQASIDLLARSLYSVKLKNPAIYQTLIEQYLLTSNDFSEIVDGTRYIATFEALAKLKDKKKIDWWNKLLEIQCRNNPNFDINHLFSQFTGFWEDMDKLQKFIPIPEHFPIDDFADAGITLGKMYRIMIKARNRFEQIKSFEEGNISHAYMLFDLFNTSMYCKEMDDYCVSLTKQLKAEDAFDKSKLKETYLSPRKLEDLTHAGDITLDQLKSYLLVFAAVNGNTTKHNNSDLAFYKALFKAIEDAIQDKNYLEYQKKTLYSTIMLFAAYGNNTTKERMIQDVRVFVNLEDPIRRCQDILDIYKEGTVSTFFSTQGANGKMVNSEAMPSLHTIVTLSRKAPNCIEIIKKSTDMIVENKYLSQALQKIMRDVPERLKCFADHLADPENDKGRFTQSLFITAVALNQNFREVCTFADYTQFAQAMRLLDVTHLEHLNQLFLDIDFSKFPQHNPLFTGKNLSGEFYNKASMAQGLDDLIFLLQDYNVPLATIKPSEQGLLFRIKQLENSLWQEGNIKLYVTNYQDLITKRLRRTLGAIDLVDFFQNQFASKIDASFSPQVLKTSYDSLVQIIETTKKDSLLKILPIVQQFPIGNTQQNVDSALLLSVTASLLKYVYPVEIIESFLKSIQGNAPKNTNAKLHYLQSIFGKIAQVPTCYEDNDPKKKLNKETTKQIKACMELMKTLDTLDASLLDSVFASSYRGLMFRSTITMPEYLKILEVLASPTNIGSDCVKRQFTELNNILSGLLQRHPDSFSDLLDIAKFDAELLNKLPFNNRNELSLVAKICKNEALLNARSKGQPSENYKQEFAQNIKVLLNKKLDLAKFYSQSQLAQPSAAVLLQLLNHYKDKVDKALHHYEKDPWFKRPHKKKDVFGKNQVEDKEFAYQTDLFDMSKQNEVLEHITRKDSGFEKSVRRNLLFTFANYINELGFRLPAFQHIEAGKQVKVPVRKLSDVELKAEFGKVKSDLARLRIQGQDDIWQNKKHQRAVCKLLAIIRETMYRDGDKSAYSTQVDAVILAILAGDYQYAMQINTGDGKGIIAAAIEIALQTITDKQIIVTTSNLSLAVRDAGIYDRFIQWFGITHAIITSTTKDKSKLQAKIIHTTGHDFALCHGKDVVINNSNKIYLNDESDYTGSHLTPSINSQSKPNEEENWWIYEEILAYVAAMNQEEARKRSEQQVQGLIRKLSEQFNEKVREIEVELAHKLFLVQQNADNKSPEEQIADREAIENDCGKRVTFYAKRIAKLNQPETESKFDTLIDSAIIAQFVLKKGSTYEVIDQLEKGKMLKKVVPTEGGKPITEGDVMYMYDIHQLIIEKTIREFREAGDNSEFIKPSALESTTYFNNYSTQAGSKSIGITGTVPKVKYKMYEALIGGGKSDVIPPHQVSQRVDAVPYEHLKDIKVGSDHVCRTEDQLIDQLVRKIKDHEGPALLYCSDKNSCEARRDALIKQLHGDGYTVQLIIPGVTEDFTDGDKLTTLGRRAQNKKTVTITVGDGRGIDISAYLLTLCSFVPETIEKLLQIYGRSGRDGKPGKTDLFILESELTKYGIKFNNLDEEFNFLDEVRHREFDFAIKKIGFMQFEIQKQIGDEQKKTTIIAYMDDLYNRLILKAVAEKVKNKIGNRIGDQRISGRWEPFVMLNDEELENIYREFCQSTKDKLLDMQLYRIDIEDIQNLQDQYHQQVMQAVTQEKEAQKGLKEEAIRAKIERNAGKEENRLRSTLQDTVALADGTEVDITDASVRRTYLQFALNLGRLSKTAAMMQKHVGTHIGIYGFINKDIIVPYKQIYQMLEQQKQVVKNHQQEETDTFYQYLAYKNSLEGIRLLLQDIDSGAKQHQEAVDKCFHQAESYANMAKSSINLGQYTVAQIRDKALYHYESDTALTVRDIDLFRDLQVNLDQDIDHTQKVIENRKETITSQCEELYQELQDKIYIQGARPLTALTDRPMRENDSKLAHLFSMLQMVTKEERGTEPVKRIVDEISKEVTPLVDEYNTQVKKYKEIIKKQRVCIDFLRQRNDTKVKINKYDEMVNFDDIASKNMVAFYHDYNSAPGKLRPLNKDIKDEQLKLEQLEKEQRLQEERNSRNKHIRMVKNKITSALNILRRRINEMEHPLSEAITVANDLLANLEQQQSTYIINLTQSLVDLDLSIKDFKNEPSIAETNRVYIQAFEGLINDVDTRRVLERDLNWGPFLNNLLKTIVNALILVVSFGQVNNFFTLEKSETLRTFDEEQNSLNPNLT